MIERLHRYLFLAALCTAFLWTAASAQTWVKLAAPAGNPDLYCVHFITATSGYVGGASGVNGRLYRTVNGGGLWTQVALPGTPGPINDLHFVSSLVGVLVADGNYVAVTTDGGATWTQRSVPAGVWTGDITAVYFKDAQNGFVVGKAVGAGNGPRMAATANAGVTWTNITQQATPANNLYDIDFFNTQRGVVVGTGAPPRKSLTSNGGATWTAYDSVGSSAISMSFYGIDAVDGTEVGYASGGQVVPGNPFYGEVRKTTDSGRTWQVLAGMTNGAPVGNTAALSGVIAVNANLVFVSGRNGNVYKTTDAGTTWTPEILPAAVGAANLRRFSRTPTDEIYLVGLSGNVLRYQIAPNATFSTNQLTFTKACPAETRTQQFTIGNDGGIPLTLDSVRITQPVTPGVNYVVTSRPNTVPVGGTGTVTVRADVGPAATPGIYNATLRLYTNDENRIGSDTVKAIQMTLSVTTKTIAQDLAVNRDAGRLRASPFFSKAFTLFDVVTNTGECDIDLTVRLARGTDFKLMPPTLTRLSSGQAGSVYMTFEPKGTCERYDTVIIEHNGIAQPSPIRVPIVGVGTAQTYSTTPTDTVNFGRLLVGLGTLQDLQVANNKLRQLCLDTTFVTGFRIAGPNASEFSTTFLLPGSGKLALGPLAEVAIPITARPAATGQRIAYAIIQNDISAAPDTVVLVVEGLKPELTTLNTSVHFSLTEVGGRRDSTIKDFLQNLSNADAQILAATIVGANAGEFQYVGPATTFDMPSGAKRSMDISFRPSAKGLRTATLNLQTTIGGGPIAINLSGNADAPTGGTRTNVVVFEATSVNSCRDTTLRMFIHNVSALPLRITNAGITDDAAGAAGDGTAFTIVAPVIPPDLVIAPGDSASITLRFCPTAPKPYIARLLLGNNTDASPFSVQLIGNGKASKVVEIDTVVFAPTRVLTSRDSIVAAFVRNREAGPLTVDSVRIIGSDAASYSYVGPGTPFVVPANSTAPVTLRFAPRRRDRHSAILSVYTIQGRNDIVLNGQAIYPLLEIAPDRTTSQRVRRGLRRSLRINVVNIGDDTGHVERANLIGSSAFSNVLVDPLPRSMRPGDTLRIFVDFQPDTLCEHAATVTIRGEGVRAVYTVADTTVNFAGVGVAPIVNSRRPEINFGIRQGAGPFDSVLVDFLGNVDFTGRASACLDDTRIDSMAIVGPGASNFALLLPTNPLAPSNLPGNSFAELSIRFQPASQGLKRADLMVYFDGNADSTRTIPLVAASALLPIEYGPTPGMFEIDFGAVRLGNSRDSTFTATNLSAGPLTIDQLSSTLPAEMQILSPAGSFAMMPNQPTLISVRFTPAVVGIRQAFSVFRSATQPDSSFRLIGSGVDEALRANPDVVDFGPRAAGTQTDSAVALENMPTVAIPLQLLANAPIEKAAIVSGAAHFDVLGFPASVAAAASDSLRLRFRSFGSTGQRDGVARVYYNRRGEGATELVDSLDVLLQGAVIGDVRTLRAELGAGVTGSPGDTVRFPIVLSGDLATAAFDTLDAVVGFRKTMLKPIALEPVAGVSGTMGPLSDAKTKQGAVALRLVAPAKFNAGTAAEIAFLVMLGDSMESMLRYDSIGAFNRPDIVFATDSARFTIADFCDAQGRLIRFDSALTFATKPNPAARATSISYTLPSWVHTRISVFDAAGTEVARIVDAEQRPGYYLVRFDASQLASGTYYCTLTAGRFTRTLTLQILD